MTEAKFRETLKAIDDEIAGAEARISQLQTQRREAIANFVPLIPGQSVVKKSNGDEFLFMHIAGFYLMADGVFVSIEGKPRKKDGNWSERVRYIGSDWELVSGGK
jgi:hypothetical protein